VFDGQTCPYHHHDFKHETFFILKGAVAMNVDDQEMVKREGELLAMKQGTDHLFTGKGDALLLEVSKPCKPNDNVFANKAIGDNGVL
jgi:quercetin dioxygenase-like cupin family protein